MQHRSPKDTHTIVTLRATAWLFSIAASCIIAACSTSNDAAPSEACIEIAKKCTRDDQCCPNLKCMWQGDGAYCQQKSAQDPPCSKGNEGCTQDSHCCSKTCKEGSCTLSDADKASSSSGSTGGASCKPDGAECTTSAAACCSRTCGEDPLTKKSVCVEPELPGPSGGCGNLGDACTLPANCCSNKCLVGRCEGV